MDAFVITGGKPLHGVVAASGAKNAALPILAASILAAEPVELAGVPQVADVDTMSLLLGHLGVEVACLEGERVRIATIDPTPTRADDRLVGRMRASFCVLGPLLARRGRAVIALPGGCKLGQRPVDLHLRGLAALGADLRVTGQYVVGRAKRLRGATIDLAGPRGPTVTGTANVLSAATLARGKTVIHNAAREPEIVDLGEFLIGLGARIAGLGTSTIEIDGVSQLGGTSHRIIADRIEAATLLLAAAITGGSVTVTNLSPSHLTAVLSLLAGMGCQVQTGHTNPTRQRGDVDYAAPSLARRVSVTEPDSVSLCAPARLQAVDIVTQPYPGIPTDLLAPLTAVLTLADGQSTLLDSVFPDRAGHVRQLRRLGASLCRHGDTTIVSGVERLAGHSVTASDLRAGAALVLAGLAAKGTTIVRGIAHLDRGYQRLEQKLATLGAQIERRQVENRVKTADNSEALKS